MSIDVPPDPTVLQTFAARLYEQLAPFASIDTIGHLWVLCGAIGSMFQPVEDLTAVRPDGLSGWANIIDIDAIDPSGFGYIAQFFGVVLLPNLDDAAQREWIRSKAGWARGRPASIIKAVQNTLTGTQTVVLNERTTNAWTYEVVTRPSETPNAEATWQAILSQKPGPDIAVFNQNEAADYAYIRDTYSSYTDVKDSFGEYRDITDLTEL